MSMKIKVCGLRDPQNIEALCQLDIDYIGFIFHKPSPRFVGDRISYDFARSIPGRIGKTGVFVDQNSYSILSATARYELELVQLHGNESETLCRDLKADVRVIKAFGIHPGFDFSVLERYAPHVDYFLFDTHSVKYGGSGRPFNHHLLRAYCGETPFFLSGGISPELLPGIARQNAPEPFALDLNSRFETAPGTKDVSLLRAFIHQIKHPSYA